MQGGFVVNASYSRGWLVFSRFSIERNPHVFTWQVGIVFSFLNEALCKMQGGFVVKASYSRGWLVFCRFNIERNPHVSVGRWGFSVLRMTTVLPLPP